MLAASHESPGIPHERLRPALRSLGNGGIHPAAARAADGGHAAPDRREEGARRIHADRPPRQVRLSAMPRRAAPRRPGDERRRDLPHLFDDQADRLGGGDDARRGGAADDHRSRVGLHSRLRRRQGRRTERRPARSRAADAADHCPGPDATHVGTDLRIHRRFAGPEAHQGRRRQEPRSDDRGECRGDRRAAAHASAGRGVGIQPVDRRARPDRRDRRGRASQRRLARAHIRTARHDRHGVLHAGSETGAAGRPVLVRLHDRGGGRLA